MLSAERLSTLSPTELPALATQLRDELQTLLKTEEVAQEDFNRAQARGAAVVGEIAIKNAQDRLRQLQEKIRAIEEKLKQIEEQTH